MIRRCRVTADRKPISCCVGLALFFCYAANAADTEKNGTVSNALSFIPLVRNNPCETPSRQLAVSPPLKGTSDGGEGYPWRALYGYCVAQFGKLSLHQDWVISYLDARPQGDAPGGNGVSFGTDLALQWQRNAGAPLALYYELGLGIQYAAGTAFPAAASRWMFTTNVGVGLLAAVKPNLKLDTAVRYLHISNGGLFPENSGYDAFHLLIGVRW